MHALLLWPMSAELVIGSCLKLKCPPLTTPAFAQYH